MNGPVSWYEVGIRISTGYIMLFYGFFLIDMIHSIIIFEWNLVWGMNDSEYVVVDKGHKDVP